MLPLVIYAEDPDAPEQQQYVFQHSPVRIGRSPMNDVVLAQGFVSQFHGLVRFDGPSTVFVDLGSTNGTEIEGQRAAKNVPVPVDEQTQVSIGPIRLRFLREDVAPPIDRARLTQFHQVASLMPDEDEDGPERGPGPALIGTGGGTQMTTASEREPPPRPGTPGPPMFSTIPEGPAAQASSQTLITSVEELAQRLPAAKPRSGKTPHPVVMPELVPLARAYDEFRSAWGTVHERLAQAVRNASPRARADLVRQALQRMPALAQEPQFQQLAQENGVSVPGATAAPPAPVPLTSKADAAARELLNQFVRSYVPNAPSLDSKKELRAFLERLADVLEAFGNAFVELRRGHDQFGRQMAVPTASEVTPLHGSKNNGDVLKYVLDWRQGADRVQELMGGFVDVMIHQIALLSGMQQGVRGLFMKLGVEELERRVKDRQAGGLLAKLGLNKSDALWQAFLERHRELLEDEQEMTKALFGPEFARAYVAIVGERSKKGNMDDEDIGTSPAPARSHARG
jgi:type VI secretion system protein